MTKVYGISFNEDGKIYYFSSDKLSCPLNVTVIVETEKGLQFGKIINTKDDFNDSDNLRPIVRIATKADYNQYLNNLKDAKEAILFANDCILKLKLNMKIINSSYTFDRKQLIFSFIADTRIDFRQLAKELASKYRTRIELHQVGARDKAKITGGIGMCGRELCCKGFLNNFQTVTMSMAKNQNIALNPAKINGCCGRLLCCLTYEDNDYRESMKDMPDLGTNVKTKYGMGYVVSIDVLNRKYKVNINNEIKEIELDKNESSKK